MHPSQTFIKFIRIHHSDSTNVFKLIITLSISYYSYFLDFQYYYLIQIALDSISIPRQIIIPIRLYHLLAYFPSIILRSCIYRLLSSLQLSRYVFPMRFHLLLLIKLLNLLGSFLFSPNLESLKDWISRF